MVDANRQLPAYGRMGGVPQLATLAPQEQKIRGLVRQTGRITDTHPDSPKRSPIVQPEPAISFITKALSPTTPPNSISPSPL